MSKNLVAAGRLGYPDVTPWEQVYKEISQSGYEGTPIVLDFKSIEKLKEELGKAKLNPAPGYIEGRYWIPEERDIMIAKAKEFSNYSQKLGLSEIFIGTLGWNDYTGSRGLTRTAVAGKVLPQDGMSPSDWKIFIDTMTQICEVFMSNGIRPCFHSHAGSVIETIDEIEILFSEIKPELLFMGPDTAQLAFGGIDPVEFFRKYISIIHAVHLKDLVSDTLSKGISSQWDYNQFVLNGLYTELGQGDIDFKKIISLLRVSSYSGVYVVETDLPTTATMHESNLISRDYLKKEIGI